ncbi:MAG: hypothetical protein ABIQ10_02945 [Gemmatimonadaceae bacterium]
MLISCGSNPDTAPAAQLATITVSPAIDTVGTGDSVRYTAVGRDAEGHVVAITPMWSVDSEDVGTITSTGLFVMTTTTSDTHGDAIVASVGPTNGYATGVRNTPPPPPPPFVPPPCLVHN